MMTPQAIVSAVLRIVHVFVELAGMPDGDKRKDDEPNENRKLEIIKLCRAHRIFHSFESGKCSRNAIQN